MPCTYYGYITFKTPNRIAQELANTLNSMGHITRVQQRDPRLREILATTAQNLSTAHQHRQQQHRVHYLSPAGLAEHILDSLQREGYLDPSSTGHPPLAEYLADTLTQTCTDMTARAWTTGTKTQQTPAPQQRHRRNPHPPPGILRPQPKRHRPTTI